MNTTLIMLKVWPALFVVLVHAGKLWFCDRMVWLHRDVQDASPEYRGWLY